MKQQFNMPNDQQSTVTNELVKKHFSESSILNLLPVAVCICDMDGYVISYNEHAVKLWGRRPETLDRSERYCGSYRLYSPDGNHLMHEQSAVAQDTANTLDNKSKEYLNRSVEAAERMKTLIEDLLIYSRSTFSTDSFENVDLNNIIEELNMLHTDEVSFKGGKIFAQKIPLIKGVSFQMKQLMYNLINNCIKYKHPNRDVDIKITCELVNGNELSWQYAEIEKQYYKISISDNGIGFDQKYANKVFEIFQRLNSVRDKNGSGIGLAICKKIVQNHKGFITATGIPDVGACFTFYIPND